MTVDWLVAMDRAAPGATGERWRSLAYAGRYGHQPLDVSLGLPRSHLRAFCEAVSALVEEEQSGR